MEADYDHFDMKNKGNYYATMIFYKMDPSLTVVWDNGISISRRLYFLCLSSKLDGSFQQIKHHLKQRQIEIKLNNRQLIN